jgi:hypothetical protein
LNEKQIDALLTILAATIAYREKPMPKTLQQEQGSQNDLSRTPQKAENKLVASPVPYVQLFRRVAPEKRNNPNTPRVHYLENNVRQNTWSKDLKDHAKRTSTEKVAMASLCTLRNVNNGKRQSRGKLIVVIRWILRASYTALLQSK